MHQTSVAIPYRDLHPGMGQAVAERTVLRTVLDDGLREQLKEDGGTLFISPRDPNYFAWAKAALYSGITLTEDETAPFLGKPKTRFETWGEVAARVALGNTTIIPVTDDSMAAHGRETARLRRHIALGTVLMSGRHLQHGDADQPTRPFEVFSNCSTSVTSFMQFLLLLSGSGVGRDYSDDLIKVDFRKAPSLRCVLSHEHPDFRWGRDESVRDALHKYGRGQRVVWHKVADSREGWAKAVEVYEAMALEGRHAETLVLDFSDVRPRGAPIRGMQYRPASGPADLMDAIMNIATIRATDLEPWAQAMYIDHYLAECVLVGGARRAARIAVKSWRDPGIFEFIKLKRPVEFDGLTPQQVREMIDDRRAKGLPKLEAFLWSANNSVKVDDDFWRYVTAPANTKWPAGEAKEARHARRVMEAIARCSYFDGTGEPGMVSEEKLRQNDAGLEDLPDLYVDPARYDMTDTMKWFYRSTTDTVRARRYRMIVNPCGEVALLVMGGYCVVADTVPYHAMDLAEAYDAFRVTTRALIRTNLLPSLYRGEVERTNRIGVGITGVHEYAWKFFGVGFRSLVALSPAAFLARAKYHFEGESLLSLAAKMMGCEDPIDRAAGFWISLAAFSAGVKQEAEQYSADLGLVRPHTDTTVKPAGTTAKLFGLTEGWHLPAYAEYLRWVQFRSDDPLVGDYRDKGYPVRELKTYKGTTIVGFPTQPVIATLGMGDEMVLAGDATPEEQYRWIELGEFFYLRGIEADLSGCREEDTANQISYTLKYDPKKVSYDRFREVLATQQSRVKCCSVMPIEDTSAYEYLPETACTKAEYEEVVRSISEAMAEDIGREHVDCASGACPITFMEGSKT